MFLQLADEHRTVNAFELQELLDACLPNGEQTILIIVSIIFTFHRSLTIIKKKKIVFFFFLTDYIKSCASMEVCRQVVITLDVSISTIVADNFRSFFPHTRCRNAIDIFVHSNKHWTLVVCFMNNNYCPQYDEINKHYTARARI